MAFLKKFLSSGDKKEPAPKKDIKGGVGAAAVPVKAEPSVVNESAGVGILIAPYITEKSVLGNQRGSYTFRIKSGANKISVRKAVEDRYGVNVTGVRILNSKSKVRRMGRREGVVPGFRKAIVTLVKGEVIELGV